MFASTQEKERKARRKGKPMQSEETSSAYPAEEEEMEGSGASGNEEEAPEDVEGLPAQSLSNGGIRRSIMGALVQRRSCTFSRIWGKKRLLKLMDSIRQPSWGRFLWSISCVVIAAQLYYATLEK